MRIALGIEYNGTNYYGWQQQDNLLTVQSQVESAISKVADQPIKVVCAGRTDVGVHASGQVVHFDTTAKRQIDAWIFGVNCYLPKDICVKWAVNVDESFHARFSAFARQYNYIIYNQKTRPAISANQVTWHFVPLDVEPMQEAAQYLLGERDFSSFRSSSCQSNSPMRNVHHLNVMRHNDLIIIDIKANAFLQHMVRNIAGLLINIGEGKHAPKWAEEVLAKRDRRLAAHAAAACGLYLTNVYYPPEFQLPAPFKERHPCGSEDLKLDSSLRGNDKRGRANVRKTIFDKCFFKSKSADIIRLIKIKYANYITKYN